MLYHVALGSALMAMTTVVHAGCTALALSVLRQPRAASWGLRSRTSEAMLVAGVVVALFMASLLEATIWGATYLQLGALSTFEEALYFSIVTFTTLGYGDVTLPQQWRLLSSFEAANGTILFGWSTALVFAFVQHLYRARTASHDDAP